MKYFTRRSEGSNTEGGTSSNMHHYLREVLLIVTLTVSIFLWVALFSYHHSDPGWSHVVVHSRILNTAGRVGAWLSDFFLYIFGYFAYLFPLMLIFAAWRFYKNDYEGRPTLIRRSIFILKLLGFSAVLASGCALLELYLYQPFSALPFDTGGILGQVVSVNLLPIFSAGGTTLLLIALFLVGVTLFTGLSWYQVSESVGKGCLIVCQWVWHHVIVSSFHQMKKRWEEGKAQAEEERSPMVAHSEPEIIKPQKRELVHKQEWLQKPRNAIKKKMSILPPYKTPATGELPPLSLLDVIPPSRRIGYSEQQLKRKAEEIELRLLDFGIQGKVVSFHPGPVVTRFELELAAGTKVGKISALDKDLARSLSVLSVRIVEVIPGKSVIGLELPNPKREMVTIHEVLSSQAYQNAHSPIALALGKDISGHPVVVDLAKMPHLLVSGTTGSGKSVGINAMLMSMLYKSTPKQMRLILIDPKMLELSIYADIPHLLTPVVTDMRDAAKALRWCVIEMERRYQLMAALSVRNINGYNYKIREAGKKSSPLLDPLWKADSGQEPRKLEELPQIVLVADEFADMMVVVGKKVEALIARLAQKARAAGIHLVLATQRPSVDVITGLIKANIPTRISFQVSSKVDSRTILDQSGAEQLLGYGDMLYLPPGSGLPVRVHGAYVSDGEVHRVIDFLKKTGSPGYLEEMFDDSMIENSTDPYVNPQGALIQEDAEKDPFYDQAVDLVIRARRISTSSIQRHFKIGYNRAARMVEAMEAAGVVSKMESNGSRQVLAPAPAGADN